MNKSCSKDFFFKNGSDMKKRRHRVMQKWKVDVRTEKDDKCDKVGIFDYKSSEN